LGAKKQYYYIIFSITAVTCNLVWDQKIRMKELGAAVHGKWEVKVRPLFTEGTGKKKSKVRVCGVMRE
jgi:hypothetical protein